MPPSTASLSPPLASSEEARDWAALPRDILSRVFLKLGPREVMLGSEFACAAWCRAAIGEPALWRRVGMDMEDNLCLPVVMDLCPDDGRRLCRNLPNGMDPAMKRAAMDRVACQCEAFGGCWHEDDDLLDVVARAPSLKDLELCIYYPQYETIEVLIGALKKLPLLEDLKIEYFSDEENLLRSICQASPDLKTLVLLYASHLDVECNEDDFYGHEPVNGELPMMCQLRFLELSSCDLSCNGLRAILDNCPVLESLHITSYFRKRKMDKELQLKCGRVKNLILPPHSFSDDSDEEYMW
ncbi:hypothetical protein ACP4OV_026846 [Aristida adscensionis]